MGREIRSVTVSFVTEKPEHLPPMPGGESRYSDDVVAEVSEVIRAALADWYEYRGRALVRDVPDVG